MIAPSVPLSLNAERIVAALPEATRDRFGEIEVVGEVASTNDILYADRADNRDRVQIAHRQTGGRGRQGRRWETTDGALCFSVLHACSAEMPAALTLWVGIALVECLHELGFGQPCLNWPNDLMYGSAKFGGILTECRVRSGRTRCVIGVGINVEETPELNRPATSITRACGRCPDPNLLAAGLIEAISVCLVRLDDAAPPGLGAYFDRYDGLKGLEVEVIGPDQVYAGRALGVDDRGCLKVEGEEGVRRFDGADVRLRRL